MACTEGQVKTLQAKLSAKHVRTRQANDTTLHYVEGWHSIAQANRIFGFGAAAKAPLAPLMLSGLMATLDTPIKWIKQPIGLAHITYAPFGTT